jgi:tetratricopeptide (TPR) repeat protein
VLDDVAAMLAFETIVAPEPVAEPALEPVVIADLLVSTPLPPAHSTRPARSIPRLDPHDFILPGELPPIVLPDHWVGIEAPSVAIEAPRQVDPATDESHELAEAAAAIADVVPEETAPVDEAMVEVESDTFLDTEAPLADAVDESPSALEADVSNAAEVALTPADSFDAFDELDELDAAFTPPVSTAAFNLALDRCERLREEVEANPGDWARRRRLAEALLEAGERTAGLDELASTALGLEVEGALTDAVRVLDDLVRVAPEQVAYHQKRVELAVRLGDRDRLRESYLDLADALVRSGLAVRAEPVYVRVLELDPWDDRARAALGASAPPPPSPKPSAKPADDGYVNLADWLADDAAPRDTRMRVKEPTVTGDEDADFDQLLQNFREGVARSLGDDDYESHYDLGVAYKEMGLLDDAVAEFQRALRSPTHRLPAYEALGQCFLEQGSFPVAVTVLSRALHEPGLDDEQRVGVLYLLGYACEALQRRDEARSYYQRVYATDIHFRDVAERLTALDGGAQ